MTGNPSWREFKRADMAVHGEQPLNLEPPREALALSDITPLAAFYVRCHGPLPAAEEREWRVRVEGMVARPLELTVRELAERLPAREVVATLQCAGNRRTGLTAVRAIPGEAPWGPGATATARWRGVSLAELLNMAGIEERATHVALEGADVSQEADPPQPFGGSIPRHKAMAEEVLLAWEMNGQPLTQVHGAPLRLVVPGYIGARSVKWLTRIIVQDHPSQSYFQNVSYRLLAPEEQPGPGRGVPLGAVAVNADILQPADGATVAVGPVVLTGYAFAGDDRRIVRVDVSIDEGRSWRQAELLDQLSQWSARRWQAEVWLEPGPASVVARAWDSAAAAQPEDPAHLWNPKGYVNNAWARISLSARPDPRPRHARAPRADPTA